MTYARIAGLWPWRGSAPRPKHPLYVRSYGVAAKGTSDKLAPLRGRLAAIERLLAKYPDPWVPGTIWESAATALNAIRAALAARPPRGKPTHEFLARADAFLKTLAIAERVRVRGQRPSERVGWLSNAKFAVESIRIGHCRTLRGLADFETDLLTEWWEGTGPVVNRFWREVRRARLPYRPRDILAEIRGQGRISTREQYDFAIDMISELEQGAAAELSRMISAYERRRSRPRGLM